MIIELAKDIDMSTDFDSEWVELELPQNSVFGKKLKAESLQISWNNASGTLNGTIEINATNDLKSNTLAKTIQVNKSSIDSDSELFILFSSFEFLKIIYHHNNISGGQLNAVLSFKI